MRAGRVVCAFLTAACLFVFTCSCKSTSKTTAPAIGVGLSFLEQVPASAELDYNTIALGMSPETEARAEARAEAEGVSEARAGAEARAEAEGMSEARAEAEAKEGTPIIWRVLAVEQPIDGKDSIFLLSEDILGSTAYGENRDWASSTARDWCDRYREAAFTEAEQAALLPSEKRESALGIWGASDLTHSKLFFLSSSEIQDHRLGFVGDDDRSAVSADTEQPCDYWLRTPVENDGLRCWYRTKTGRPAIGYQGLVLGARPALRLDASRVLLLTRGPDAKNARLLKNGSELPLIPEAKSDELRLTLISDQLPQPEIANVSCNADVLTFDCACVGIGGIGGIGGNATVSALLTDASFEHALGYGRLMDAAKQSTATLSVRLPADFKLEGKKLWVFVETSDGGTSDNASKPILLYDGSTLQQSDGGSDETQD